MFFKKEGVNNLKKFNQYLKVDVNEEEFKKMFENTQ